MKGNISSRNCVVSIVLTFPGKIAGRQYFLHCLSADKASIIICREGLAARLHHEFVYMCVCAPLWEFVVVATLLREI